MDDKKLKLVDNIAGLYGLLNGLTKEQPVFGEAGDEIQFESRTVDNVTGTYMYMEVEANGGGDLHMWMGNEFVTLNCTTGAGEGGKAKVDIIAGNWSGGINYPAHQTIYAYKSGQTGDIVLTASYGYPSGAFVPIAYLSINNLTWTQANGALRFQRVTEATTHGGQGALSRERENTRLAGKSGVWIVGVDSRMDLRDTGTTVDFITTPGIVYQMNRQLFGALSVTDHGAYIFGQKDGAEQWKRYDDLADITHDGNNVALINGDMIYVDVFGIINNADSNCKLAFTVSKKYTSFATMEHDMDGKNPKKGQEGMRTVMFPIGRMPLKRVSAGHWDNPMAVADTRVWINVPWEWKTPNYPNNYPANMSGAGDTKYTSAVANTIGLRFNVEIVNTETCCDKLYIQDVNGVNRIILSGWFNPFQTGILWWNQQFWFKFRSDWGVQAKGIRISSYDALTTVASNPNQIIDLRGK